MGHVRKVERSIKINGRKRERSRQGNTILPIEIPANSRRGFYKWFSYGKGHKQMKTKKPASHRSCKEVKKGGQMREIYGAYALGNMNHGRERQRKQ